MRSMAGEFVRTPKAGSKKGRYTVAADLPIIETVLAVVSFASTVASVQTGHYFATPFALLFTVGYGYIALLVAHEQAFQRRRPVAADGAPVSSETPSLAPASSGTWTTSNGSVTKVAA